MRCPQTIRNNKGIVLIAVYFVLVAILGLSAISFIRTISEGRLARKNYDALAAFYAAEAGIAYAYAEASRAGFQWYTHEIGDDDQTLQPVAKPPNCNIANAVIDPEKAGIYTVAGQNFRVKTFSEKINGKSTGVLVVRSKGTVNDLSQVLEYRLFQTSPYEYFFFFSQGHTFDDSVTFGGRNAGGIHVNGNIYFVDDVSMHFLTRLTAGSENPEEGYFIRPLMQQFYDGRNDTILHPRGQRYAAYGSTVSDVQRLNPAMLSNINRHFATGTTTFRVGEENDYADKVLDYYLAGDESSDAYWEFDKYIGEPDDEHDNLPIRYAVSEEDLQNLALYELSGHAGEQELLSNTVTMQLYTIEGSEKEVFRQILDTDHILLSHNNSDDNDNDNEEGNASTIAPPGSGDDTGDLRNNRHELRQVTRAELLEEFWKRWKANRNASYRPFGDPQLDQPHLNTWLRYFYRAAYDWPDQGDGAPDGVNLEWWHNPKLLYGADRYQGDQHPAQVVNEQTGEPMEAYVLNTREQIQSWSAWLADNGLNVLKENNTLVRDKSQGQELIAPERIFGIDYNRIEAQAKSGGIYVGPDDNGGFTNNLNKYNIDLSLPSAYAITSFFNAKNPFIKELHYSANNILVIDMRALKEGIEKAAQSFNGIVYIDLDGYPEIPAPPEDYEGPEYRGVMLVNGETVPEGGISIVTKHPVYIKGDFNLQASNYTNRQGDDRAVIERIVNSDHTYRVGDGRYSLMEEDLSQSYPSEVITKGPVYFLSESFPEPHYMPLAQTYSEQYDAQLSGLLEQEFVSDDRNYPTNDWVPKPANTKAESEPTSKLVTWFEKYDGGQDVPTNWTAEWIEENWPPDKVFKIDTDEDGRTDEYILGKDLREAVKADIAQAYQTNFAYASEDGDVGADEVEPVLLLANKVAGKHIYNLAVMSPYQVGPYVLEDWSDGELVLNGAFIQLPQTPEYRIEIPAESPYHRISEPRTAFNYEPRFSRSSGNDYAIPPAGLIFGMDYSWRESKSGDF